MHLLRLLERNLPFEKPSAPTFDANDVCGSVACHFKVDAGGGLSMYRVDDSPPTPQEIAIAMAATRKGLDEVAWCMAEEPRIQELGVEIIPSAAKTPVEAVNESHVDVTGVTLGRLSQMILVFMRSGSREEIAIPEVAVEIVDALSAGILKSEDLHDGLHDCLKSICKGKGYKRARQRKDARLASQSA
jgi:hypothetical protein